MSKMRQVFTRRQNFTKAVQPASFRRSLEFVAQRAWHAWRERTKKNSPCASLTLHCKPLCFHVLHERLLNPFFLKAFSVSLKASLFLTVKCFSVKQYGRLRNLKRRFSVEIWHRIFLSSFWSILAFYWTFSRFLKHFCDISLAWLLLDGNMPVLKGNSSLTDQLFLSLAPSIARVSLLWSSV